MNALNPTAKDQLLDEKGRPYFLWDEDTSLEAFVVSLKDPDPDVRAYRAAKLMRQAKPDDVFTFLTLREITELWQRMDRHLGRSRPFWIWLLEAWKERADDRR